MEKPKLNAKQLLELVILQREMAERNPSWRQGQALFNAMYKLFPEVSETVRGTLNDPFYNDTRIERCFEFIQEVEKIQKRY